MNFTSSVYLPDSEERINHLRKIIAGRPVAILAAGPSLMKLEERICELKNADICYFGLNKFSVQETKILYPIGKHASVIMDSCRESIPNNFNNILEFLKRPEDNMFISSFWWNTFELLGSDFDLNIFLSNYNKKLIFFSLSPSVSYRQLPDSQNPLHFNRGNSLQVLIQLAIIGKASRIIIFGADGYCDENSEHYYYRPGEYGVMPHETLIEDTNLFNATIPLSLKNVYKTYNLEPIEILNCSEKSYLTPFPKISYDIALKCLTSGEKFNRISDLRVPKVSIISRYLNNSGNFREMLYKISQQSYSNYEHIIFYDEMDDKIQDFQKQFPQIKWVQEKNIEWVPAMKKGISMARGDYIFQYNFCNGSIDEDWLCNCVEILENNSQIALVWGISDNVNTERTFDEGAKPLFFERPSAHAKNFIYYWLKQKIVFPQGNVCVRKNVFSECLQNGISKTSNECEAWIAFNFNFNSSGYQPFFVPKIADCCRTTDILNRKKRDRVTQNILNIYYQEIDKYKKQLIEQKLVHHYRDGYGKLLPDGFNHRILLFFIICEFINKILPEKLSIDCEEFLDYLKINQRKILKIGMISCWHRLIKNPCAAIWLNLRKNKSESN